MHTAGAGHINIRQQQQVSSFNRPILTYDAITRLSQLCQIIGGGISKRLCRGINGEEEMPQCIIVA
jgi:hypothetical protein